MGAGRFSGSPWHISHLHMAEGDTRRHRSRCAYYDRETKRCSAYCSGCLGASHCGPYRERRPDVAGAPSRKERSAEAVRTRTVPAASFRRGERVVHKSFGDGIVVSADGDRVTVRFPSGGEKTFLVSAVAGGLLRPA